VESYDTWHEQTIGCGDNHPDPVCLCGALHECLCPVGYLGSYHLADLGFLDDGTFHDRSGLAAMVLYGNLGPLCDAHDHPELPVHTHPDALGWPARLRGVACRVDHRGNWSEQPYRHRLCGYERGVDLCLYGRQLVFGDPPDLR